MSVPSLNSKGRRSPPSVSLRRTGSAPQSPRSCGLGLWNLNTAVGERGMNTKMKTGTGEIIFVVPGREGIFCGRGHRRNRPVGRLSR